METMFLSNKRYDAGCAYSREKEFSRIEETQFVPKKYEMQVVPIPARKSPAASWNKNLQVRSIAACLSGRGKSEQHRAPHELTARCS